MSSSSALIFLRSPARQTILLFLLSLVVLLPGIWEATALTGKDEFFLGLRTPIEMIESDQWLVPFLDGAPRIRKPPLLYWLGRASYEVFGISLTSARAIGVLFASLLIVSTAGIARRLTGKVENGWIAGCILLGCMGLASESRRFMLDVPVAALSTAAFWAFLVWLDLRRLWCLTTASLLLAAGFLTKGPIVALVFGGGVMALLFNNRLCFVALRRDWMVLLGHGILWATVALPWFFFVRALYPEAASLMLADELESRHFFSLSPGIVLGMLSIALPWGFVFMFAAWQQRRSCGLSRLLLVWFVATLLPFFFITSFDRYLIGSLVPVSIFLACALPQVQARWPFRLGITIAILLGGSLAGFAYYFGLGGWYWLVPPAYYLCWAWWQRRPLAHTLAAPAIFWTALMWGVFPALGVNAVPTAVVDLGRQRDIAMFDGPQPAMQPILSGRAQRHYSKLDQLELADLSRSKTLVFVEEKDFLGFQRALDGAGYKASELGSYKTLASHGSGLRFAKVGAKLADWQAALVGRSLDPLMTEVRWFEVGRN